jgi:hypothetical protein
MVAALLFLLIRIMILMEMTIDMLLIILALPAGACLIMAS